MHVFRKRHARQSLEHATLSNGLANWLPRLEMASMGE